MHIEAVGVSHTYDQGTPLSNAALSEISLTISAGERVGVLGPTGSGKSTLAQVIAGLLIPTAGQVLYDGAPLRRRSVRNHRKRVGFALQYPEDQIFERTVFREVAFGPKRLGLKEPDIRERVQWALERVGLSPQAFADRSPFALSGGETRRVALASILSMRPEVLILDEPTAGLDPRGRRELLALISQLHEETGCTLIIVSHDVGEIGRVVERAIALREGRLAVDGPVRSVLGDRTLPERVGLHAPPPVALLQELAAAGWPVATDHLLPEEAAAAIYSAWRALERQR